MGDEELNDYYSEVSFSFKSFAHAFVSSAALAIMLLIVIWVINYFNYSIQMEVLSNLNLFLISNWYILVNFTLLISIWDYLYPLYKRKLNYVKPLIDSIGLIFGFWLVAIFLYGLKVFVDPFNEVLHLALNFMHDVFFELNILLFLLFLFVSYAKFLIQKK
jgi:hypothetical protein